MKDLTVGKEGKQIFYFALPLLLSNVFQQLYTIVDTIIVGKFIGKEALGAVGISFPIIFLLISLIIGIAMGGTVIVSQYFGAKDFKRVKRTIDTLMIFLFFAAIILTVIGIIFSENIFRLMKAPEEIIGLAKQYLDIYLLGLLAFFGFNGISAILRGMGDSKTPLVFMIISTITNIILDLIFVLVLKWGISGVAIATIVSQGGAFVAAVVYLNRTHKILNFTITKLVFDKDIFRKTLRIGVPSGLQTTFVALGMIVIMFLVNRLGDINVIAAYSAALRIDALAMMPAMNFGIALSVFVGQNLGANKIDRIKKGLISSLLMSSAICIIITLTIFFLRNELMHLFIRKEDVEVIRIGTEYLVIVSSFYLFFNTMFNFNGILRGAGDTFVSMLITLFALWVVRIPIAYFLSERIGEKGIWWAIPIAWFVGMICSAIYYSTGRWKRMGVVKHHEVSSDIS